MTVTNAAPPAARAEFVENKARAPRSAAATPGGTLFAPRDAIVTQRRAGDLVAQPLLNKGTAFSEHERERLGLRGLLPPRVMTIDEQVVLELEHLRRKTDDLERYIGLAALQDRNETLFYRVLAENLDEFLPIVYTPTVGRACQEFSHIMRRPRGVWITPDDLERMDEILRAGGGSEVRLIVVTDNERILGLGDQGAGGMAIPVGKLAIYTVAAGIYPAWTLPVSLDVGTDRRELLDDPLYLGYRAPRLRGPRYDQIVEAFVESVRRVFPTAVVQWEDFKQHNALSVLKRYRHRLASFNDDVQGTGAVVLGGLLAARRTRGDIADDRFMLLGAGAAGIGIARMLCRYLEGSGVADPNHCADGGPRIVMVNSGGLLHADRSDIHPDQRTHTVDRDWFLARGLTEPDLADPVALARAFRPTVLIGTTGTAGTFSRELIEAVAAATPRPVILPLSNPSERAEARAEDVVAWTSGRAIVATGSPTADIVLGARRHVVGQANNAFIFPGVGLGAIIAEARALPDDAFVVAARELAGLVSPARLAAGGLYPPISDLRGAARSIAIAVVRHLRDSGYGRQYRDEEIEPIVDRTVWRPEYARIVPV